MEGRAMISGPKVPLIKAQIYHLSLIELESKDLLEGGEMSSEISFGYALAAEIMNTQPLCVLPTHIEKILWR